MCLIKAKDKSKPSSKKISHNVEGYENLILLDRWRDSVISWISKLLQMLMWILKNRLVERLL